MVFMNVFSCVILGIMCVITFLVVMITHNTSLFMIDFRDEMFFHSVAFFYFVLLLWMILHEIIHAIAYRMMGAKRENIVFGVALEKGVFYCKCREYIPRKSIMVSLLSPFLLIGVITYILGFFIHSPLLILLSIFNICGAAGDLMMFFFFLKQEKGVTFKEMGFSSPFCLRTKEDLTGKKYIGIKSIHLVKDIHETEEEPERKLTISKFSYLIGFLFLIFILFFLFL